MKVAILGCGAMGEAIAASLIRTEIATAAELQVSDASVERRDYLKTKYEIQATAENSRAVSGAEVVILAVKPQELAAVGADLAGALSAGQLIVSILAGVPLHRLHDALKHDLLVRAMPNTPAQIGEGMTVWVATPGVDPQTREKARLVLGVLGPEVEAGDEKYLDMATAVNGSGPGFVYLFIEAFIDAAVHIGFPRQTAQQLVLQTIQGSVAYQRQTGKHPAQLRNEVTSPAGTTAAGLYELEQAGLRAAVLNSVVAAYERSKELGS
jgi:pyrroline-5-carboxylate reductase